MATKFVLRNGELRATTSGAEAVAKFLFLATFRFFLGKPMNGKRIDNSTFLKGATKGKAGKVLTRWQKKPHLHRALIRGAVYWPIVGILALTIWNRTVALSVLAFLLPFLAILAYRKGRLLFFVPFSTTDAENGVRTQHWILQNRWRKLIRMQPIPGLVTRKARFDDELPHELQEAIKAQINAELRGGEMPVTSVSRAPHRRRAVKQ